MWLEFVWAVHGVSVSPFLKNLHLRNEAWAVGATFFLNQQTRKKTHVDVNVYVLLRAERSRFEVQCGQTKKTTTLL